MNESVPHIYRRPKTAQDIKDEHTRMQARLAHGATAIIYTRAATKPQSANFDACGGQESVCRQWCENYGWQVVDVVRDSGVKGRGGESARHVMRLIKEHRASIIVAYNFTRFTREYIELRELMSTAESRGMRLLTIVDPMNPGASEDFSEQAKLYMEEVAKRMYEDILAQRQEK